MKQIWGLRIARLRMAHVTGTTSVLASVGGREERTLLGIQDHPWTTLWALILARPNTHTKDIIIHLHQVSNQTVSDYFS